MTTDARAHARQVLLADIAASIFQVFLDRGYAQVTVEEASRAAGISRATFFRYFGSKEDVVVAHVEATGIDYEGAVRALVADRALSPWQLVRAAVEPAVTEVESDPELHWARLDMIATEPSLRIRLTAHRMQRRDAVARAVQQRTGNRLAARIASTAGLAAYDLAWDEWTPGSTRSFRSVVDEIFVQLESLAIPAAPARQG
nr:TetR family transcriptional regulator [uncultured Microbacterium sp.]